jgi:hypothetical protein
MMTSLLHQDTGAKEMELERPSVEQFVQGH